MYEMGFIVVADYIKVLHIEKICTQSNFLMGSFLLKV